MLAPNLRAGSRRVGATLSRRMARRDPRPQDSRPRRWSRLVWLGLLLALLGLWVWQERAADQALSYTELKQHVRAGEVERVELGPEEIRGRFGPGAGELADESFETLAVDDPELLGLLEAHDVEVVGARVSSGWGWVLLLWILLPLLLIGAAWRLMAQRVSGTLGFGKSPARMVEQRPEVNFGDVAGCEEAKAELHEVVDFLRAPERYEAIGAKIPKGVLLVGPPGTGKTLLARAVAGEAKVPFYSLSGSDFVEMFVGVGAARVRDLFEQAKRQAPCIVFIDELDAIGRRRGVHVGMVNDEREQTLNQLLVELDGFRPNSGVILLAATNRPDVLDPALLRPGRFDRQVVLDAPDMRGRLAILRVHTRGKPVASDVDLESIAQSTPGFSGADLANAVNEAALTAARRGHAEIAHDDLASAVEKVVAGPERRSRVLSPLEKRRVAVHEAGHAIVAHRCGHDPVHKVSVVPRGRAALGYTRQVPLEDRMLATKSELRGRLDVLLAGRAAELLVLGEPSTGSEDDLARATILARTMVAQLGMGDTTGLARNAHSGDESAAVPGAWPGQRDCSEATAEAIDAEVERLLRAAHDAATDCLHAVRDGLDRVIEALLRVEVLDRDDFVALLDPRVGARRSSATG